MNRRSITHRWRQAGPHDSFAHLVRIASLGFIKAMQVRLAEHGVSIGHWTFLRVLWNADGITQRELGERAGLMKNTTFSALQTMEAKGFIVRKQLLTNKKNVYVHLTAEGRALKDRLIPLGEAGTRAGIEGIDPKKLEIAREVLLAIIDNLATDETTYSSAPPDDSPPAKSARATTKRRTNPPLNRVPGPRTRTRWPA